MSPAPRNRSPSEDKIVIVSSAYPQYPPQVFMTGTGPIGRTGTIGPTGA